jgi:uncharacterized membrane protein
MIDFFDIKMLLDAFGKTHPAVAHFPVALLIAALAAELIAWKTKNAHFQTAGKFCLVIGTGGAVLATLTGFPFTELMFFSARPPLLVQHQLLGYAVVLVALLACVLAMILKKRLKGKIFFVYLLLLVLMAGLIVITSHTGGMLVYGEEFFCPAPVAEPLPEM